MKVNIVVFPGSNCDHDMAWVYNQLLAKEVDLIWHTETELSNPDVVVVPGGFSYGDYLRTGALAKLSPIMDAVRSFADQGGSVIGICNGFQILCEAGLLPGVLLQNRRMKFLSRFVHLKVEQNNTPFTQSFNQGDVFSCPIAHFDGNYFVTEDSLKELEDNHQVVFRYCLPDGTVDADSELCNPNGSLAAIAGVCNKARNVVGLMPHPERAAEKQVDVNSVATGLKVFQVAA